MGVDTKGFIATPVKDVLLVCGIVEKALNKLILDETKKLLPQEHPYSARVREQFSSVRMGIACSASFVSFDFLFKKEARNLKLFFDCDCDHRDVAPKSLSLMLGCWGSSELLMKTVLHALSMFGTPYFDLSDCDDIAPAVLDAAPITVLEGVAAGYLYGHMLETIVEKFDAGELRLADTTFDRFVGLPRVTYDEVRAIEECRERWDAIEKLASERYPNAKQERALLLSAPELTPA